MNKDDLRSILSAEYNADKWRAVLREVFGARSLQKRPKPVALPANNLADAAFELGSFETSDDRLVGLYQVDLKDNVRIGQNRVGLRSLLRNIYKYDVDAALVVFVQNDKWRLSLISEIRVLDPVTGQATDQKTEPKRFTYLLGVGETVRTAADRLQPLSEQDFTLEKLIDAFSVEKLTKAFFKRYKELFGEFCEHLTASKQYRQLFLGSAQQPKDGWKDPAAKPIRDFAKILLGRLVFLQFLQKKGWMGVPASETAWENGDARFLKNLFERTKDKDHFHSGALRKLFFETLNRKRTDDLVDRTLGENIRVPYLNGGLFDTDITTGNAVDFPKELFADLLEFFEQYNFTIDEDDPYDREVGIDPEMLGHIFENLLEENREKGAFYTPKEIVHYMCQESLIEYLATHLPEGDRPAIETLVRDNQIAKDFTGLTKATEINRLLRDVKICDPAIGSGAFPMGLLKEIFECRRLIYPYLKTNETFDPARIKKDIIQNNIYGVDIDNGAVEIARLRFWLALVVDEIEPAPLPNLDYKIMQGNSLLEQFEDISLVFDKDKLSPDIYVERNLFGEVVNPQTSLMDVLRVQQELGGFDVTKLESEFFGTEDTQQKAHIREQLNRLERLVIEQAIKAKESSIRSEIAKINAEIKHKQSAVRAEQRDKIIPAATHKKLAKLEAQLEGVEKSKERLQAIRPDNKPYFLWHLYFQDVFENGGFDIVIGNPPYIRADSSDELMRMREAILESKEYETLWEKWDFYVAFIERGFKLLKKNGITTMIVSDAYCHSKYAIKSQDWFLANARVLRLDFLGSLQIFEAAVRNVIFYFKKSDGKSSEPERRVHEEDFGNVRFLPTAPQSQLTSRVFFPEDNVAQAFDVPITELKDICYISKGMVVHADEKVAQGSFELSDLVSNSKDRLHSKAFVEGKFLSRWLPTKNRWLEWGTSRAPGMFSRPTFKEIYEVDEKLISVDMAAGVEQLRVAFDNQRLYHNHSAWSFVQWYKLSGVRNRSLKKAARYRNEMPPRPDLPRREDLEETSKKFDTKFLLAVMNSTFARDFLLANRRSNIHLYPDDWKKLPVANATPEQQKEIVAIVNRILDEKRLNLDADISKLESKLDKLVFALYGL